MATTTTADMNAASAASAPAATTTATSAAAATASAAATTTATGELQVLGKRGRSGIFLVVDIECRQTDVENFLLAEKEFMTLSL
ncbi:MAG: hypothetical protein WBE48_18335 [Xanthobacteraceae bacterium]